MRHKSSIGIGLLILSAFFLYRCNPPEKKAAIPDIQSIYSNIYYLDSLIQSERIDSVEQVNQQLTNTLQSHLSRAQSPDDKAILDSLHRINTATITYLRFCTDSRSNLELLKQDLKSVESQYKSGKINMGLYISALIEGEQTLVDLYNEFTAGLNQSLISLRNQSTLLDRLSPLPD